jgi:small subunit ribosomal protein S27Ae
MSQKEEKPKNEERPRKEDKQKTVAKQKSGKKIYTYYVITGDKLTRKLIKCPRCGSFMGLHKGKQPRWTCGSCSYTDYSGIERLTK